MTDDEIVSAATAAGVKLRTLKPTVMQVIGVVPRAYVQNLNPILKLYADKWQKPIRCLGRWKSLSALLQAIKDRLPVNPNGFGAGVRVRCSINPTTSAGYAWHIRTLRQERTGTEGVIVGGVGEPSGNWQVRHDDHLCTWWDEAELTLIDQPEGGATPTFRHECKTCAFLGIFEEHDLYVCLKEDGTIKTVIARFGSDGPDYASGLHSAGETGLPCLREALARARIRGLKTAGEALTATPSA
jgi:hypothetical protein